MAALMGGCSLQGMAQQITPKDVAGDKEYNRVCREYELKGGDSMELLQAYLDKYPDSRHKNRVLSLIASAYFMEGKYKEAIALFRSCDLEALPDKERDDCAMRLATSYLKEDNLREAAVWFTLLKEVSPLYQDDAVYNLAYIDYVEKRYDKALKSFQSLQNDAVYAALVPYYIGEIYLVKGNYQQARTVAKAYLEQYPAKKDVPQMERIWGEACFGLNDYQAAIPPLERYRESVSHPQRKPLYELGMSYYYTGVYSKAAATLGEMASVHDALSQNAYLHMGLAYLNLKERNRARMAFEQAANFSFDPKVKEQALYNYALCIHETSYSPFAESVTVFERFLNEFPNSPYTERVNDYLIEVYMNTRSYEAALKSIAKIEHPGTRIMEAKQKILFRLGTQAFANAVSRRLWSSSTNRLLWGNTIRRQRRTLISGGGNPIIVWTVFRRRVTITACIWNLPPVRTDRNMVWRSITWDILISNRKIMEMRALGLPVLWTGEVSMNAPCRQMPITA